MKPYNITVRAKNPLVVPVAQDDKKQDVNVTEVFLGDFDGVILYLSSCQIRLLVNLGIRQSKFYRAMF